MPQRVCFAANSSSLSLHWSPILKVCPVSTLILTGRMHLSENRPTKEGLDDGRPQGWQMEANRTQSLRRTQRCWLIFPCAPVGGKTIVFFNIYMLTLTGPSFPIEFDRKCAAWRSATDARAQWRKNCIILQSCWCWVDGEDLIVVRTETIAVAFWRWVCTFPSVCLSAILQRAYIVKGMQGWEILFSARSKWFYSLFSHQNIMPDRTTFSSTCNKFACAYLETPPEECASGSVAYHHLESMLGCERKGKKEKDLYLITNHCSRACDHDGVSSSAAAVVKRHIF
jgi:hypothetical protein